MFEKPDFRITDEFRLTDDLERRLVREMAYEHMHSAPVTGDVRRSLRHVFNAVRNLLSEINIRMGKIGEARYS